MKTPKRQDLLELIDQFILTAKDEMPRNLSSKDKLVEENLNEDFQAIRDLILGAELVDNAQLCVVAVLIELRKWARFDKAMSYFDAREIQIIHNAVTKRIREDIYSVDQIEAELALAVEDEDVGL